MRYRLLSRVAAVALAAAGIAMWVAPDVGADSPVQQGWWSRWQQPTATVGVTLPVTIPPPPTGQPGGLTIAREVSEETAVAALYFQVAKGADLSLYLAAAEPTGIQLPPDAVIRACLATKSWQGQLNGSWADAPTWSEDTCERATVVAGNAGLFWDLPSTMQDRYGAYDVVIVPGGRSPYFVNLAPTGDHTGVPDEVPPPETTTTTSTTTTSTSTTTTTPVETIEETDPLVTYEVGGARGGGGVAAPVTTTTAPPRQPTTLVAFDPSIADVLPIPDSRAERIFAVSLLFFMATALWWLSGSPARMPRLIGALAADARRPVRVPAPERGVGRFARPREGVARPPRL